MLEYDDETLEGTSEHVIRRVARFMNGTVADVLR